MHWCQLQMPLVISGLSRVLCRGGREGRKKYHDFSLLLSLFCKCFPLAKSSWKPKKQNLHTSLPWGTEQRERREYGKIPACDPRCQVHPKGWIQQLSFKIASCSSFKDYVSHLSPPIQLISSHIFIGKNQLSSLCSPVGLGYSLCHQRLMTVLRYNGPSISPGPLFRSKEIAPT